MNWKQEILIAIIVIVLFNLLIMALQELTKR